MMREPVVKERSTKQKDAVIECLRARPERHHSAEELAQLLRRQGRPVALSTLYRCLSSLEKGGLVRRISLPDSPSACYQFIENREACVTHYHLLCAGCGELVHFQDAALASALAGLRARQGLGVNMDKTMLHGLCRACGEVQT